MDKVIKKSFNIVLRNSSLMLPLVLYLLFIMIFSAFMGLKISYNPVLAIPFLILVFFIIAIFLSGWLGIIKYAVDNYPTVDKDSPEFPVIISRYNFETIKKFFSCVGEYFLPMLIICIIFSLIIFGIMYGGQQIFHINLLKGLNYLQSQSVQTIQKLAIEHPEKMLKLSVFALYLGAVTHLCQFLLMFWLPTVFYKTKKPISALFKSLGFLFKNFLFSVCLYFFIFVCSFIMNIFGAISELNTIFYLIFLFFALNYLIFVFVLIFEGYRYKTVENLVNKVNSKDIFIKSSDFTGVEDDKKE